MKEFQKRQRTRRLIYSIPSLILLSIVTIFLVRAAVRIVGKERDSSERSRGLEEKVSNLILREQELKEGVGRLQTEEGIKDEIRERFSVTQEGEYMAVIVDNKTVVSPVDLAITPWYKRLWNAIMSLYD